eukprot:SAG31_NODE_480_length_15108_cov_56.073423_16_plen_53_part_00
MADAARWQLVFRGAKIFKNLDRALRLARPERMSAHIAVYISILNLGTSKYFF